MSKVLRQIIVTSNAPRPVGAYSQAIKVDNTVYLSGVLGIDRKTNKLISGTVEEEARQLMANMEAILQAAGSSIDKLVKTTIMLNDINDFNVVNEVYKDFFTESYPARSTYQVGKLPLNARVEMEAIGLCGDVISITLQD